MNWVQSVNIFCLEMTVNTLHAQEMMSYPFSLSKYLKKKISSEQLYDSKQQRKYESLFCNEHTISQRQAPLLSISCCSFPYLKIDIKECLRLSNFLIFLPQTFSEDLIRVAVLQPPFGLGSLTSHQFVSVQGIISFHGESPWCVVLFKCGQESLDLGFPQYLWHVLDTVVFEV